MHNDAFSRERSETETRRSSGAGMPLSLIGSAARWSLKQGTLLVKLVQSHDVTYQAPVRIKTVDQSPQVGT